jgi:tRNA modification GTPase
MIFDNHYEDTIIAQCTPQGSGAIALLRLSGKNALAVADSISSFPHNKTLLTQNTHTIHFGLIVDKNKEIIDQVLFLVMHAPHTFTGDNTVEITCHNNPFIINNIINAALNAGARIAQNGEFSQRAVLNNKIDITQAEAINDLIHANTQLALKQSLSQLHGSFSHWITTIEKQLIKALALSDASFEFLDEENMEFNAHINEIIMGCLAKISSLQKIFDQQQQIRQGIRIAIIGSVNAGKSSFFNALLNQERAIVTNIAGTTRDSIEAGVYKNDNYWTLIDTAGLRKTNDIIEQIGITRSYEEAQKADIILLVFDGSQQLSLEEIMVYHDLYEKYHNKIILIKNKSDLDEQYNEFFEQKKFISISSVTKTNINHVEEAIQQKINHLFATIESPFLLNKRHFNVLLSIEKELLHIGTMLMGNVQYELVSYHLKNAISILSELSGKTISEAGMDAIFREFCIGK